MTSNTKLRQESKHCDALTEPLPGIALINVRPKITGNHEKMVYISLYITTTCFQWVKKTVLYTFLHSSGISAMRVRTPRTDILLQPP